MAKEKCAAEEPDKVTNTQDIQQIEENFWIAVYERNYGEAHNLISRYDLGHILTIVEDNPHICDNYNNFLSTLLISLRKAIVTKEYKDIEESIDILHSYEYLVYSQLLWVGVIGNNLTLVRTIANRDNHNLTDADTEDGHTPLTHAAENGYVDMVSILIQLGASIFEMDNEQRTAFEIAVRNQNQELINILIANINENGGFRSFNNSTLYDIYTAAIEAHNLELVNFFLEDSFRHIIIERLRLDISSPGAGIQGNLLSHAVYNDAQEEVIRRFVEEGEDVSKAFFIAANLGMLKHMSYLLEQDVDINIKFYQAFCLLRTPLDCQIESVLKPEVTRILLDHGAALSCYSRNIPIAQQIVSEHPEIYDRLFLNQEESIRDDNAASDERSSLFGSAYFRELIGINPIPTQNTAITQNLTTAIHDTNETNANISSRATGEVYATVVDFNSTEDAQDFLQGVYQGNESTSDSERSENKENRSSKKITKKKPHSEIDNHIISLKKHHKDEDDQDNDNAWCDSVDYGLLQSYDIRKGALESSSTAGTYSTEGCSQRSAYNLEEHLDIPQEDELANYYYEAAALIVALPFAYSFATMLGMEGSCNLFLIKNFASNLLPDTVIL